MNSTKKNNYKSKILETLDDFPSGLTISDISDKTGAHRNTVSNHLRTLENEGSVSKKEIGSAHLYFSRRRGYLSKVLVNSFLQALLSGLRYKFPNRETIFKEIGHEILKKFQFPIGGAYIEEFKKARKTKDQTSQLKLFEKFYNSYDFFQDDLDISIQKLTNNEAIFRLSNSEYLKDTEEYLYFFYIACGITEGIYLDNLDKKVSCNVEKINISKEKEGSYIDISLKLI
ncbi:MAG: helix-turn-helix domain-containing protein [Candidatus Hermodarchaeota archaeon]